MVLVASVGREVQRAGVRLIVVVGNSGCSILGLEVNRRVEGGCSNLGYSEDEAGRAAIAFAHELRHQ